MMKDSGEKQAVNFPRYGKLFRDFSTLWKIPRMRDHTVENEALVAWTSRSAHLPVLLHGFFCSARTRGPRYGEPLPRFRIIHMTAHPRACTGVLKVVQPY